MQRYFQEIQITQIRKVCNADNVQETGPGRPEAALEPVGGASKPTHGVTGEMIRKGLGTAKAIVADKLRQCRVRLTDPISLMASNSLDIQEIESVCLALGPYRNLTTLTASILFLHPNCQVLNHAGARIHGNRKVDFLSDYTRDNFDRFVRFAVRISGRGQSGRLGGSILHSHAFARRDEIKEAFRKTGLPKVKQKIKCLFWKESLRTSNLIREKQVDLARILGREERLCFLMPIRNPLDCAVSNLRTGHVNLFRGLGGEPSVQDVTHAILDEIFWFADFQKTFPDRFFCFFEHQISRTMLIDLAEFLKLDADETWISNTLSVMNSKKTYDHDGDLIAFYRDSVKAKGGRFPELSRGLLGFLES